MSLDDLEAKILSHGSRTPQQSVTVLSKAVGCLKGVLK